MANQTYEFHSVQSLMATANKAELQAAEKPLLTFKENDPASVEGFDDVTFVDGHKLVYNQETGQPYDTVSDDYEIINPPAFIGPLCERLNDRDRTDVSGQFHVRNDGASVFGTVLFDETDSIYLPGRGQSNPVKVGFTIRWSHNSGMSVRSEGFAQDTACKNSIRQVTSSIHVKHSGDVDGRVDWHDEWDEVLDELGAFSESLAHVIDDAMNYTLYDLTQESLDDVITVVTDPLNTLEETEPPGPLTADDRDGFHGVYELLGLPRYLASSAADRLMWRLGQRDDPRIVSAWDTYSAATYALTHHARGAMENRDDYHRDVNDLLMNPERMAERVRQLARAEMEPDDADMAVADEDGQSVEETTGEALRAYSGRSRDLKQSFGGH